MTRFYKLSGGGNDFIALTETSECPSSQRIARWCRRGTSEGADGLFLLHRVANGVRMRHFNSDGGRAALCLNGTRCAARLAFDLGWAEGSTTVTTDAGEFAATDVAEHEVEMVLPRPTHSPEARDLVVDGTTWTGDFLVVGVPHLVVTCEGPIAEAPVAEVGAALRRHPDLGPDGANVDFVAFPDIHRMQIRSFERGVEAETLACGTGVLAATVVGLTKGGCELPVVATTRGGFEIVVGLEETDSRDRARSPHRTDSHWTMRGDARLIATGELESGADAGPEPPPWS